MKVMAFNGSSRKRGNTAALLEKALEGARPEGAETELIHIYDLDYKGCKSCFVCKLKGSKSYGRRAQRDALTPLLEEVKNCDALILGSELKAKRHREVFPEDCEKAFKMGARFAGR
jgi:multimeric flavodoxin WrbA